MGSNALTRLLRPRGDNDRKTSVERSVARSFAVASAAEAAPEARPRAPPRRNDITRAETDAAAMAACRVTGVLGTTNPAGPPWRRLDPAYRTVRHAREIGTRRGRHPPQTPHTRWTATRRRQRMETVHINAHARVTTAADLFRGSDWLVGASGRTQQSRRSAPCAWPSRRASSQRGRGAAASHAR